MKVSMIGHRSRDTVVSAVT